MKTLSSQQVGAVVARPASPSPGKALSVLIAICAVLWLWSQWPDWYYSGSNDKEAYYLLCNVVYSQWVLLLLPTLSNGILFWWSTGPLWSSPSLNAVEELKRGVVLVLCLLFHLVWALIALLCIGAAVMYVLWPLLT
jgi:hypothetical protein